MKRLFLACTPRTGNVWARKMLACAIGGIETAAHRPGDIAWEKIRERSIVAMHWHLTPEFQEFLQQRGYDIVVTLRHPLDVLISILHFSWSEPATAKWLDGEGGSEGLLRGVAPSDPAFLRYALSPRAEALLSLSAEWYAVARAVFRYEDLVARPEATLREAIERLGYSIQTPLNEVVHAHTLDRLRPLAEHHFWRGEAGLWRRVIAPKDRQIIYQKHQKIFQTLGYPAPEGYPLSASTAKENWLLLCEAGRAQPASVSCGTNESNGIHGILSSPRLVNGSIGEE